jgi:hypothetical protein
MAMLEKKDVRGRKVVETLDEAGEFDVPCLDARLSLEQLYAGIL